MAGAVIGFARPGAVLDLCCGTGLLTQRLCDAGYDAIGIDADAKSLAAANSAGVTAPLERWRIDRESLPLLSCLITQRVIKTVVARRALPELFGHDLPAGGVFAEMLAASGVRDVFLEGRIRTARATNPLASLVGEVELFAIYYKPHARLGNVAYLRVRE